LFEQYVLKDEIIFLDEVAFEHREVNVLNARKFEDFYNCLEEVGK